MYNVVIKNRTTGATVKTMGPLREREAEKVFRGASINLNHKDFAIEVVPAKPSKKS